jgi:hypothetical protein
VNRFIDHLQVVTTNNYYAIDDFHTTDHSTLKSSQFAFTGLYLVTPLRNGYSSATFSLDVFWEKNLSIGDSSASVGSWLTHHS